MKTPRIDLVGQNGNDGLHYKYEEVVDKIMDSINYYTDDWVDFSTIKTEIIKILVENFPDE